MGHTRDAIRYPAKRVLLHRTRLAYAHLRNLLTDAKRDRAARVSGYVAVWMPEELLCLYLEEGEVVTATASPDGAKFAPLAINDAIGHVPTAAEYGSICFHEATNEQLDLMYASQVGKPMPWPRELVPTDPDALLKYLYAMMHDGAVEVAVDGAINYVAVQGGKPVRGYFVDTRPGDVAMHLRVLLDAKVHAAPPTVRLWPTPEAVPAQASPALIQAYRELMGALSAKLVNSGKSSAAQVIEGARRQLAMKYQMLERFAPSQSSVKDPVTDGQALTKAIAQWISDVLFAASPDSSSPEDLIRELTGSRRHMFQSAGFYDSLPWKVKW